MNINDRELLELAAKAAGIPISWTSRPMKDRDGYIYHQVFAQREGYTGEWNPLTDDGAALRLAVLLRIDVEFFGNTVYAGRRKTVPYAGDISEDYDCFAITRRVIVIAAAEIGKLK